MKTSSNKGKFKANMERLPVYKRLSMFKYDPEMLRMSAMNKTRITMNYNVCQILIKTFCWCCPGNKAVLRQKLYDRGYKNLSYDMNILTYIRKMHEVDIIKHLIFNENEICLLNFISKPSVSLVSKNEISDSLQQKFDVEFNKEEIDKLHKSFHDIIVNDRQTESDRKLLKIVASEIDNLTVDF